jgi:hypothetical protein
MYCINPNTPQYQEILKEVGNPLTANEIYRQRYLKDGVDELFEQNPELSSIGTPEEYSSYMDVSMNINRGSEEDIRMFQEYLENQRVEEKRLTPEKMELLSMARETLSEEEVSIVENLLNGDVNFTDMSNFTCS